jgi:uridine phosphorylase
MIQPSELIINPDGTIFHLHLRPEDIADSILMVGDMGRVEMIASYFDKIDCKVQNREFVTITGWYKNKRVSIVSTGIGTDNIDIVVTELDALVNIDFKTREIKAEKTSLNLIRIGTSGSLQGDIPINAYVVSEKSIGFDGLLNFYAGRDSVSDLPFEKAFLEHMNWNDQLAKPYVVNSSEKLFNLFSGEKTVSGVNISSPGFYGPQGRVVRLPLVDADLNDKIETFEFEGRKITNYEMESSAIYGFSKLLGHEALTICLIIANRVTKEANANYYPEMKSLAKYILDRLAKI